MSWLLIAGKCNVIIGMPEQSVHWVSPPPLKKKKKKKKAPFPSFLPSPLLNLQTDQAPPFLSNPPFLYIGFLWTHPKNCIFLWTPIVSKIFIQNPISSFIF